MLKNITQQMQYFVFVLRLNHPHICSVIIMYCQNRPFFNLMKSIKNIKSAALQSLLAMVMVVMFAFSTSAQSKIAGWERVYAFSGEQLAEAKDVVQTLDEGFAMISQDNSNRFRLIKTDPDGDIIWEQQYGGLPLGDMKGRKLVQTQDGGYAALANCLSCGTADGTQNIIVFRLDRYGESIWETVFGLPLTDIDTGVSIKQTNDGGFIIGGIALTEENAEQAYFKKIDANGVEVFESVYGDEGREFIQDIEETEDGFVATGYRTMDGDEDLYIIKLNATGDSLWSVSYGGDNRNEGSAITFTYDDNNQVTGYLVAGLTTTLSNGNNVYLVQVDTNGDAVSDKILPGGSLADQAYDIRNTQDGGYILTGITEPNPIQIHTLLTKIDADLEVEWSEDFGVRTASFAASQGLSVQQTKDGGFAIVGFQSDPDDFNQTYGYLLKTDNEGQIFSNYIEGRVYNQTNNAGIEDWIIEAKEQGGLGRTFFATSEADGRYELLLTTGTFAVSIKAPNVYWEEMSTTFNISVPNLRLTQDFPIAPSSTSCTDLEVDISTPYLIPGEANLYTVHYCNHGNELAIGAFVDVKLDENLSVIGSSIPNLTVGDIRRFQIGNLDFGDCGEFTIETSLNSAVEPRQTHCVEAEIFPNTICVEDDPAWDGSSIGVTAVCDEIGVQDSVRFQIRNQGNSDMQSPLGFIVIEDIIMRDQPQPGLLNAGEVFDFAIPATGATYRIMAEQALGHPGDSRPTAAIEGCGGFTSGNYTRFSEDDYNYANELDCQENVPNPLGNSKRGYPKGAGDSLLVAADADMIYHLKFQNTGQDTAIRVVIRDTISSNLDPTTIRPGTSSHDYDFEVYAGGILKFTFEDILLPGSSTDEAGSHIYVKYRISQKPNNQVGTPLVNGTAITFEFNEPEIITEPTQFVGGVDFLVSTDHIFHPELEAVNVYPNPFSETATFELATTETFGQLQFTLYDVTGREVKRINFSGNRFDLQRTDLTNGMYIYRIESNGTLLTTGKLIAQ